MQNSIDWMTKLWSENIVLEQYLIIPPQDVWSDVIFDAKLYINHCYGVTFFPIVFWFASNEIWLFRIFKGKVFEHLLGFLFFLKLELIVLVQINIYFNPTQSSLFFNSAHCTHCTYMAHTVIFWNKEWVT